MFTWFSDSKSSISLSYEVEPNESNGYVKFKIFEQCYEYIEIKPDPGTVNSIIRSEYDLNHENAFENVEICATKSNEDDKGDCFEELDTMHNYHDIGFASPELFHLEAKKENETLLGDYCKTDVESPELLHLNQF